MTFIEITQLFIKYKLYAGRMISGSKTAPKDCLCVFNSNVICKSQGKIWFGDLNITKESDKLKKIAFELGEPLYVLRERDCRFERENDPIDVLISKAVWSTLDNK